MADGHAAPPVRALVLAGGGAKCAYQAGVLQVWLDEVRVGERQVEFDLADGTSGGVLNLALWCQGESGRAIADAWRAHRPLRSGRLNPWLLALQLRPSVFTLTGLRDVMLPAFGIDYHRIRTGPDERGARRGTFTVWDVTDQQVRSVPAAEVTQELLLAAVAPPVWFPPVRTRGHTYTDAVFATDANLEAVLHGGATELWIVWTVSTLGRWRNGWSRSYFQLVETAANSRLRADLDRVRRHNRQVEAGRPGEFGDRPVDVRLLHQHVPVGYLLDWRRSRLRRAVDLGVRDARRWVVQEPDLELAAPQSGPAGAPPDDLLFRETLSGGLRLGGTDPWVPVDGDAIPLTAWLTVTVRDVEGFLRDPAHRATVTGSVRIDEWLPHADLERGTIELLVEAGAVGREMRYDLLFRGPGGELLRLRGVKDVCGQSWLDSWSETTTLGVTLVRVLADRTEVAVGAGQLRLTAPALVRQLASIRAFAPTLSRRLGAVRRFAGFFAGELLAVYGRRAALAHRAPAPGWLTAPVR